MNNLFLCRTPLQAMYLRVIIEREGLEEDDNTILYLKPVESKFHDYAISKIISDGIFNSVIVLDLFTRENKILSFIEHFNVCLQVSSAFRKLTFGRVFVASIDCVPFQIIISRFKKSLLYTFDDGSANINKKSSYFIGERFSLPLRLISIAFRNSFSIKKIKEKSCVHFTMFEGENIIDNKCCINDALTDAQGVDSGLLELGTTINVFLGTVYTDLKCYSKDFMNKLEQEFEFVDVYYQHPRDNSDVFSSVCVDDFRISEVKLLELKRVYTRVNVIAFPSTTILHLKDVPGFTFKVIHLKGVDFDYGVFESSCVEILELPWLS